MMGGEKEIITILGEQIEAYTRYESLCHAELKSVEDGRLDILLGVMKNKARLIEELNGYNSGLELLKDRDSPYFTPNNMDVKLKKLVEEAIKKVEKAQKLEEKIKNVVQVELENVESELLDIHENEEILRKYSDGRIENARFIDVNR